MDERIKDQGRVAVVTGSSGGIGRATVTALAEGFTRPVRIGIGAEVRELAAGEEWVAPLRPWRDPPEGSDHTEERGDRAGTRL